MIASQWLKVVVYDNYLLFLQSSRCLSHLSTCCTTPQLGQVIHNTTVSLSYTRGTMSGVNCILMNLRRDNSRKEKGIQKGI